MTGNLTRLFPDYRPIIAGIGSSVLYGTKVGSVWERRSSVASVVWTGAGLDGLWWRAVCSVWLPASWWLQRLQILANDGSSLVNQLVDPAGISGTDAASPSRRQQLGCTRYRRLLENLQLLAACIKGSELSQKAHDCWSSSPGCHSGDPVAVHCFHLLTLDFIGPYSL